EIVRAKRRNSTFMGTRHRCEIPEPFRKPSQLCLHFASRPTDLINFNFKQLGQTFVEDIGRPMHDIAPFRARQPRPESKRFLGHLYGFVNIVRVALGHLGKERTVFGIVHRKYATGDRRPVSAADEFPPGRHGAAPAYWPEENTEKISRWISSAVMTQPNAVLITCRPAVCSSGPSMVSTQSSTTTGAKSRVFARTVVA